MKQFLFIALLLCIAPLQFVLAQTPNVRVTITDIRSSDGEISIGAFKDDKSFDEEEAYKSFHFSKSKMSNGKMVVDLYLPPGTYGLTLLDDENKNQEMEYNWLGIPKEGFGFSDYWHTGMTKPDVEEFDIKVVDGKVVSTTIKIKYMIDRD